MIQSIQEIYMGSADMTQRPQGNTHPSVVEAGRHAGYPTTLKMTVNA